MKPIFGEEMIMSVLVTQKAPKFEAPAVMPDGTIVEDFRLSDLLGKYVLLFFWPLDFTFVCPTEIIAHDKRMDQFKERNVEVVPLIPSSPILHGATRQLMMAASGR
jgi:peroxiredoxin (alkyl hydroperoxide reductase subunit C)